VKVAASPGQEHKGTTRRVLRETPVADSVALPALPLRRVEGLPGDGGRHQLRDTVMQLRDMHGFLQSRRERFGPNFTHGYFGFVEFSVGEPELVRELLVDRGTHFSSRMGWDFSIGELFEGGLMLRDFDDHRAQRNIMQAAFRPGAMRGYLDIINPIVERTLTRWAQRPRFRFFPAVKALGLEVASELLLGESLEAEVGRRVNRSFVDVVNAAVAIVRRPIPPTRYWKGMRGRAFLNAYFTSQIEERRRSHRSDLLSQLCRAQDEAGDQLTDQEIAQHIIFLLFAAHDTTSSALTTATWALTQHPGWQRRLRQQIDALRSPAVEYDQLDQLTEMDWVFKESLRVQPPGAFMMRRTVREMQLGPYRLPKNLSISPVSRITHYLPEWWTEPTRFDPMRFSPQRAEHKRHPGLYFPFGGGAHACLGVHLATMQAKAFLYQLLRRFTVTLDARKPIRFQTVPMPHPTNGLPVRLQPVA
jgi:cytochrome P450